MIVKIINSLKSTLVGGFKVAQPVRARGSKLYSLILLLFLFGCGRKQGNFFDFSDKNKKLKVNKLSLPAVQGFYVKSTHSGCLLMWNSIQDKKIKLKVGDVFLTGYDIYKFRNSGFIPKKPINNLVCKKNSFLDQDVDGSAYYLVRAVFKIQGHVVRGPASQIVYSSCHPETSSV